MSPETSPQSGVLYVSLQRRRLSEFMGDVLFACVAVWVINVCILECSSLLSCLPFLQLLAFLTLCLNIQILIILPANDWTLTVVCCLFLSSKPLREFRCLLKRICAFWRGFCYQIKRLKAVIISNRAEDIFFLFQSTNLSFLNIFTVMDKSK